MHDLVQNMSDSYFPDQQHRGSLFTLFLHSPLWGLCVVTGILEVPFSVWDRCQTLLDRFMAEASRLITRARNVGESTTYHAIIYHWNIPFRQMLFCFVSDSAFIHFFGDDFLRLLILRYVFCNITFRLHRAFKVGGASSLSKARVCRNYHQLTSQIFSMYVGVS